MWTLELTEYIFYSKIAQMGSTDTLVIVMANVIIVRATIYVTKKLDTVLRDVN